MPLVEGDLRVANIVSTVVFGSLFFFFLGWNLITRKPHLKPILFYTACSLAAHAIMDAGLLIGLGTVTRTDGVEVSWLRPAFYTGIYFFAYSLFIAEYFCFDSPARRWTLAVSLGLTMAAPLGMVLSPNEDHRTYFLCLALGLLLYSVVAIFWFRRNKRHVDPSHVYVPWHQILALCLLTLAWLTGGLMFLLGHSFLQRINFVQETWGFFAVGVVTVFLVPLWAALHHCPCPACPEKGFAGMESVPLQECHHHV